MLSFSSVGSPVLLHSPSLGNLFSGSDICISSDYPRVEDKLIF